MEHIAALLLLVGCSQDLRDCTEIPAPTAVYETDEDCSTMLKPALDSIQGKRPRTFGTCVFVDPAMEEEDAELAWEIRGDGKLYASIEVAGPDAIAAIDAATTAGINR